MSSDYGHRDAAEKLSEKYFYFCSDIDEDPFEGVMDMDLLTHYLMELAPEEDLVVLMMDDFSQGILLGRVIARMLEDLDSEEAQSEEESEEYNDI